MIATAPSRSLHRGELHQPARLQSSNPHRAGRTSHAHHARFPPLEAFGRRPPECAAPSIMRPASETLHISGSQTTFWFLRGFIGAVSSKYIKERTRPTRRFRGTHCIGRERIRFRLEIWQKSRSARQRPLDPTSKVRPSLPNDRFSNRETIWATGAQCQDRLSSRRLSDHFLVEASFHVFVR